MVSSCPSQVPLRFKAKILKGQNLARVRLSPSSAGEVGALPEEWHCFVYSASISLRCLPVPWLNLEGQSVFSTSSSESAVQRLWG